MISLIEPEHQFVASTHYGDEDFEASANFPQNAVNQLLRLICVHLDCMFNSFRIPIPDVDFAIKMIDCSSQRWVKPLCSSGWILFKG